MKHQIHWFRLSSQLWFSRTECVTCHLFNGVVGRFVYHRRTWFGPAIGIAIDNVVTHGWDPVTIVRIVKRL